MGPDPDPIWKLAKQMGIENGVFNLPNTDNDEQPWEFEPLRRMTERAEKAGITVQVIESRPPMDDIRLGRDGRDEQIENVCKLLENMGRLGIPIWCWGWRAHFHVIRTSDVVLRGESKATAYNHQQLDGHLDGHPLAKTAPSITKDELWENVEYFLEHVVPVAEEAGVKLALHPDDPPINDDIAGTHRIMTSVEAFDRVLDLYPSEYNGLCFGQGNVATTGVDIPDTIRHFGDSIHFVHFRDVRGTPKNFYETWHDNGQTDMLAAMEAYREIGFDGPIRPDHFPEVTVNGTSDEPGTSQDSEGHLKGRLFAIGYMLGLLEQTDS